jgi:hypothetical protein
MARDREKNICPPAVESTVTRLGWAGIKPAFTA